MNQIQNKKFKILVNKMTQGYIDLYSLHKGIYESLIPTLYPADTTIETIKTIITTEMAEWLSVFSINEALVNIEKCELIDIELNTILNNDEEEEIDNDTYNDNITYIAIKSIKSVGQDGEDNYDNDIETLKDDEYIKYFSSIFLYRIEQYIKDNVKNCNGNWRIIDKWLQDLKNTQENLFITLMLDIKNGNTFNKLMNNITCYKIDTKINSDMMFENIKNIICNDEKILNKIFKMYEKQNKELSIKISQLESQQNDIIEKEKQKEYETYLALKEKYDGK